MTKRFVGKLRDDGDRSADGYQRRNIVNRPARFHTILFNRASNHAIAKANIARELTSREGAAPIAL